MKHEFSPPIFEGSLNIKFNQNPSSGSRVFPKGQTDAQTDMTELIATFCNFADAPKNVIGCTSFLKIFWLIKPLEDGVAKHVGVTVL